MSARLNLAGVRERGEHDQFDPELYPDISDDLLEEYEDCDAGDWDGDSDDDNNKNDESDE